VGKIDLVLACGDLPFYYLEYVASLLDAPLFFCVRQSRPPNGACPRAPAVWGAGEGGPGLGYEFARAHAGVRGLLLAGLEGCRVYNPGAPHQYGESEVWWQAFLLANRLRLNRIRYGRYLDILITHAPPRGIHDAEDVPHQGFASYLWLLRRARPCSCCTVTKHVYGANSAADTDYGQTRVVNTYGYRIIELARRPGRQGWELVRSSR